MSNNKTMGIYREKSRSRLQQWLAALSTTLVLVVISTLGAIVDLNQMKFRVQLSDDLMEFHWTDLSLHVGIVIGAVIGAIIADNFGRKFALLLTPISVVGGIIEYFSTSIAVNYVFLVIIGISVGITCISVPLYISEIADDEIRGNLLMLQLVGIQVWHFLLFAIGHAINYEMVTQVVTAIPLFFLLAFIWFPETPYYLVSKKQYQGAAKSLAFFRGIGEAPAMEQLEDIFVAVEEGGNQRGTFNNIPQLCQWKSVKGLIIIGSLILTQWQSSWYFQFNYNSSSFIQFLFAGLSRHLSDIINCILQIVFYGILFMSINVFGGKLCLMISTLGGLIITAISMLVEMRNLYVIAIAFSLSNICQVMVIGISIVLAGELFSMNFKSTAIALLVIFKSILKILAVQLFQHFPSLIAMRSVSIAVNLLAFLVAVALVPNTKKKSFIEIQTQLAGNGSQSFRGRNIPRSI